MALLFWVGFRRRYIPYERQPRLEGQSAWTLALKLRYCLDSTFNFTDLPLRVLLIDRERVAAFSVALEAN